MRTFIAIDISDELKSKLADLQARIRKSVPNLKFTAPHQLHLTLKFLGEIDESQLPDITAVVEALAARRPPFEVVPKTLGTFGRPTNITVMWLGLTDPSNILHALHADLERSLAPLGFPPEERPFKAHLTLARNKNPNLSKHILKALESEPPFKAVAERVETVTLYESKLESTGAVYRAIGRFGLGAATGTQE